MQREDERLIRLRQQRSKDAIDLAMQGRWREAEAVNREIIEHFPKDVDAYNRLGRACIELGEYLQAKEAYNQAVEIDPYNVIAKKNLQRLSYLKEPVKTDGESDKLEPHQFIEEIGKAGIVNLYDLASREVRAKMVAGDKVYLKVDGPKLAAENGSGEYLGQVAPRHALRLIRLMAGGNRYSAAVISSDEDMMTIIIREVYQDSSQVGRLSFPPKGLEEVRPYVGDRVFKLDTEEEETKGESGYTIVGGEGIEVMPEETADADDDTAIDEE